MFTNVNVIATRNILSVAIEYYLIYAIYRDFPALGHKKIDDILPETVDPGTLSQNDFVVTSEYSRSIDREFEYYRS